MKYLFVLAAYNDNRQEIFDKIFSKQNKVFCGRHDYKYVEIRKENNPQPFRGNYTWNKFKVVDDLLTTGVLKDDDIIVNIDADMLITNINFDLMPQDGKTFSYSIDSGNTHCMGWFGLRINHWGRNLISNILSEDRYLRLKDKISIHERFKTYSSFWNEFREQASWYSLAGIKRHSDIPFWDIDNFGFHSEMNEDVVYTIEELHKNVDVFPTSFNVTEWEGESSCNFNINKLEDRNQVYIRHFAGGQDWNNFKNWL